MISICERIASKIYSFRYKRKLWQWESGASASIYTGKVLMYHHVTDEIVDEIPSCICAVDTFEKSLENLLQTGYEFVTIQEALHIIENRQKRKFALVTFDDVPESVYINAYPILVKHNIPFAVFITTDFLDRRGYVNSQQLKDLDNNPLCTVGAHTVTHPFLRRSDNAFQEIQGSKSYLEQILGHSIDFFAYPYGGYSAVSSRIRKQVIKAGFKCAFCTVLTDLTEKSSKDLFFLPRVVMN